jgi:hypothetical protein
MSLKISSNLLDLCLYYITKSMTYFNWRGKLQSPPDRTHADFFFNNNTTFIFKRFVGTLNVRFET